MKPAQHKSQIPKFDTFSNISLRRGAVANELHAVCGCMCMYAHSIGHCWESIRLCIHKLGCSSFQEDKVCNKDTSRYAR